MRSPSVRFGLTRPLAHVNPTGTSRVDQPLWTLWVLPTGGAQCPYGGACDMLHAGGSVHLPVDPCIDAEDRRFAISYPRHW